MAVVLAFSMGEVDLDVVIVDKLTVR